MRWIVGVVAPAALATTAWAQDYTVTAGTVGQYMETRPAGATVVNVSSASSGPVPMTTDFTLPFEFPYFGRLMSKAVVTANGMLVLGAGGAIGFTNNQQYFSHAPFSSSVAFPFSSSGDVDGLVAPHWTGLFGLNDGTPGCGYVYAWTTGTAPNRRLVISWESARLLLSPLTIVTIQCRLDETTGRIVFSYSSGWSGVGSSVCGIDSPVDSRFIVPPGIANVTNANNSYSGADIVFDPRSATYTGKLLYDKLVSDASGIGNSTLANQPLAGVRVELRRDGGVVAGTGTTAADGGFSVSAVGVATTSTGTLVALAKNGACSVSTTLGGASPEWTANTGVAYASGSLLGTSTLGVAADATGSLRAAFNVARVIGGVREWTQARTSSVVVPLQVAYDDAATAAATMYVPASASPAALFVAGAASSNPDGWDDAMIAKTYGRHVLASIAALPPTTADYRFNAVSDPKNAFAEAFGLYLWSAATGGVVAIDGKSATSAAAYDLESPTITVAEGPDVAGCVAGALHDLLDPANEAIDLIDGSAAPERTLALVDASAVAPTAGTFLQAWVDAGYDAHGVTRAFVANGALADDSFEPNDGIAETASFGPVGFVRGPLVLNRFDEDWFTVTLPSDASALAVEAAYDQASTGATASVEIYDPQGVKAATGVLVQATGAVHAQTGWAEAGTWRVCVRHVSGGTVPTYTLQAYVPPTMDAAPLRDWTVYRAYDFPVGAADGVAPYVLSVPTSVLPPGLALDSTSLRAKGTPTTPGSYQVTVQLADGGSPSHVVVRTQTVVIHAPFQFPIAPFVGFPAGKAVDATLPTQDGTPPFTLSMSSGALPAGLAFAPNSLHVTGTAALGPSTAFELDGEDVARSEDYVQTRGVVCVAMTGKKIAADLAAGTDACGWWFDAVAGSTVTFSVATGKGKPKRALTGALLAPSRALVTTGKIVSKSGSIAGSKLVCPQSGRYYFVASSTDAGAATQLLGTPTVKLPTSGKGSFKTFAPSQTTSFEFGAVPGSTAVVKFTGDKKATLTAKVLAVLGPDGVARPFAAYVKPSAVGGTLTMPLEQGGTWTIVLGATSGNGTSGKFSYTTTIKQAKGGTYSAD